MVDFSSVKVESFAVDMLNPDDIEIRKKYIDFFSFCKMRQYEIVVLTLQGEKKIIDT